MQDEISGAPVPATLPYAAVVNAAAVAANFWPMVAYAIFYHESIHGEVCGWWNACTVVSPDGGHGLGQLTPSASGIPIDGDYADPANNAAQAIANYLVPLRDHYVALGFSGLTLLRFIAAAYNAGESNAWAGHLRGDLDLYTTNRDYADWVTAYFNALDAGTPLETVAVA